MPVAATSSVTVVGAEGALVVLVARGLLHTLSPAPRASTNGNDDRRHAARADATATVSWSPFGSATLAGGCQDTIAGCVVARDRGALERRGASGLRSDGGRRSLPMTIDTS